MNMQALSKGARRPKEFDKYDVKKIGILGAGLMGAGIAYVLFNGYTVSTLAGGSFTQTAFAFAVTGVVVQQGMSLALTVGLIGGVFPAFNAARRDITEALRSI